MTAQSTNRGLNFAVLLRLGDTGEPVEERTTRIENGVRPQNSKVSPSIAVAGGVDGQKIVRLRQIAEIAVGRGVRVREIAASLADEGAHISSAGLAGWWIEVQQFEVGTDDIRVCKCADKQSLNKITG